MSAVRDTITMNQLRASIAAAAIANTTPVEGLIIDTVDFHQGVGFYFGLSAFTSGDFTISIEHGEDPALADAAEIEEEMYISQKTPRRTLSAATGAADSYVGVGCFSTKRFVRPVITGANTPDATAEVLALLAPKRLPAT